MAFLGPHAKVITPDLGPAIHIIMDRPTGKTMDCYVEFFSTPDARAASNSLNLRPRNMVRINDRVVDVATSSQAELLKELFPKAKNVSWEGGMPTIQATKEVYDTGFKTFMSAEEMGLLVRHAEQPHRVSDMTRFSSLTIVRLTCIDAVKFHSEIPPTYLRSHDLAPSQVPLVRNRALHLAYTQPDLRSDSLDATYPVYLREQELQIFWRRP